MAEAGTDSDEYRHFLEVCEVSLAKYKREICHNNNVKSASIVMPVIPAIPSLASNHIHPSVDLDIFT